MKLKVKEDNQVHLFQTHYANQSNCTGSSFLASAWINMQSLKINNGAAKKKNGEKETN